MLGLLRPRSLSERILSTSRSSLVAYWMLDDQSGPTATDASGNGRTGTGTDTTLGQPGIGDTRTSTQLGGSTGGIDIYSASLAAAFNKDEGTAMIWIRTVTAMTDGIARVLLQIRADSTNKVVIARTATNFTVQCQYMAGGTNKTVSLSSISSAVWHPIGLTWSKSADQMRVYWKGVQQGATLTGLGTWAGALNSTTCYVGANAASSLVWSGQIAHAALWSSALTPGQMSMLGRVW